jgi:hypothetical protein
MQFEEGWPFLMDVFGRVLWLVEVKNTCLPIFELACFDA